MLAKSFARNFKVCFVAKSVAGVACFLNNAWQVGLIMAG